MGIDRSDDSGEPPATRPDHPAGRPDVPADHGQQSRREQIEPRSREEAYADLRAATESQEQTEPAGRSEPGARAKPREPPETGKQPQPGASWDETAELSRWMWGKYKLHFAAEERPEADESKDPPEPGSWHSESGRSLSSADNHRIDEECVRIEDREREIVSPGLRMVESCDLDRHLVGFDDRLKGRDRIKEKVANTITEKGFTAEEALSRVPDAIRFTFQYDEARYTQGVWADTSRMQEQGFALEIRKNTWLDDQYKGINSQWVEPRTGQRFELQFHTRISYEAKQLTHDAYERIRTGRPDPFEHLVLEAFQSKVTEAVPIPPGAADIPDYPERGRNAK